MFKLRTIFSVMMVIFLTLGCASKEIEKQKSADELYQKGYKHLNKTSYKKSAEFFERIELEHPYSKWAVRAKIMGAYSHYKAKQYDDAIITLDRFIKFHPGNKDISYAYYLKAMCYYEQINVIEKDQSVTEKALDSLRQVVARFPDTEYAKDAELKIKLTHDFLAGREMDIGRYYLKQKNYLSALNRFSEVVNDYQTTSHIEEALYRQVEIYTIWGLKQEAKSNLKVLEYNYPQSKWTKRASKIIKD